MSKYKNIYIEITNECNLACSFCPKTARVGREIAAGEFEHIISKTKHRADFYYLHVMGEPLLNSHVLDIFKVADKHSVKIKMVTNGTLLHRYYEKLKDVAALKKIIVSLSCIDSFSLAEAGRYLDEVLPCVSYLLNYTSKSVTLRALNECAPEIQNLISQKVTEYLGEDFFGTYIANPAYKGKLQFEKSTHFTWPVSSTKRRGRKKCLALNRQIAILSNGDVVPCCMDSEGETVLGNIFSSSLEDIESTDLYKDIKSGLANGTATAALCQRCTFTPNT